MVQAYMVVNLCTKRYIEAPADASWDGDWKQRYPHVADENYIDIGTYSIWEHNMACGIPFDYDLCHDGMLATLLVDVDKFSKEDIEAAKEEMYTKHDIVSLTVLKVKKYDRSKVGSGT